MTQARDFGEFDYVIAGGGTAGCVLANRLSADPDVTVLLLEAGGKDDWIWIHIPIGYLKCINNPRTDWCYKTEAEPGLNGRSIIYARGRVLGGCSSINGMLYLRGQVRDYEEWARITGDARWNWESVLPVFKRSEDYWGGADAMHGDQGEWRVEKQRLHWDILDRYTKAAQEAGIPFKADYNRGDNFGIGHFEVNQKKGVRWNASKAMLRPVLNRPNLKVVTGALIDKLVMGGKEARGVEFSLDGATHRVTARIETLLTAGAIGSPGILQRSGIGPANLLQNRGVPLLHDLPGVGGNLQDHLQLRMIFKVHGITTLNQRANSLWGKAMMGLEYALFRSGPLSMAPSQLGGFFHSSPEVATPDLEFHVQPLSLEKFGDPLHSFPAFTASVCNLRPSSRGVVHIRDRNPATAPVIAPNYLSTENDRQVAARALRLTRNIVAQPAMAPYRPEEHQPGAQKQTDEELARAAGDIGTTIFHPTCTCAMGRADDPNAVVDSELRVRGLGRLRVVDASIMPTITSGNTNAPTVMIAERGAELIRAARKA
ncbi:MAG: GMC family oxidoreductase N-terminal domain-containing protein [Sulfuritalea sp.]|jgi:choline dehydrogenase|nr:GMC family oxidoreductase N-terminal domain-containing protein [Sulfuritalea sp.]MBP8897893.1 GMC family oxidoreductase N-terminal domain-containing protein [Sulfuritalea sp.]